MIVASPSIAVEAYPPAAGPPPLPAGREPARAVQHFTTATRRAIPDGLLGLRIGSRTVAGALNDQVRVRVERPRGAAGDPSRWRLVADSPAAAALLQSRAGVELIRPLTAAIGSIGGLADRSNLRGFILPPDTDSLLAALLLARLDALPAAQQAGIDPAAEVAAVRAQRAAVVGRIERSVSLAEDGWVVLRPDAARAMLAASGAYRPAEPAERALRDAAAWTRYLPTALAHEVQHTVTPTSAAARASRAGWIEEATAALLTTTPSFAAEIDRDAGMRAQAYAGRLGHRPTIDLGWGAWQSPVRSIDPGAARAAAHIDDVATLQGLTRLAGADYRTRAGRERVRALLQAPAASQVPMALADAIILRHGLDPRRRADLRSRIVESGGRPAAASAIAREFGIDE